MKPILAIILSFVLALSAGIAASAPTKTPTEAYLAYIAAVQSATTLDEVLPLLSKEYRNNLSGQPAEKKPVWLQRMKEANSLKDLKITRETIKGAKCTLEGTAISSLGFNVKGKVHLVKESGEWKFDEAGWST